ncbi:hypothetical protein HMI56_001751 [Coelomomyces lativittatus]|nr:hypothetical protein HMI56_001751 [Coelomomyces lativittatus]
MNSSWSFPGSFNFHSFYLHEKELLDIQPKDYIRTDSGNLVSLKTLLQSHCILRGDLRIVPKTITTTTTTSSSSSSSSMPWTLSSVVMAIGKYVVIRPHCILRPPYKTFRNHFNYYPMKIGDFVYIGEDTLVEAASIGHHVYIGRNCVIGRFSILKEGVCVLDNTVIPPHTVIPSHSLVQGDPPHQVVKELPECIQDVMEEHHHRYYQAYLNAFNKK